MGHWQSAEAKRRNAQRGAQKRIAELSKQVATAQGINTRFGVNYWTLTSWRRFGYVIAWQDGATWLYCVESVRAHINKHIPNAETA